MGDVASDPPRPSGLATAAEFVTALRQLRLWSGLTFRMLTAMAKASGDSLPSSTIASALSRSTLPKREVVAAFVRACGLGEAVVTEWVATRDALAMGVDGHTRGMGEVWHVSGTNGVLWEPWPAGVGEVPSNWAEADPGVRPWPTPVMLAPDIPDFTGRKSEVAALVAHLTAAGDRSSTALAVAAIAGMGGIGKTTLAVHVAHRVSVSYPDGQLWVNLHGTEPSALDATDVLARFLRALGVDSRAIPPTATERAELFRTRIAGRRVLMVLDNAASEEQVRPLLPGAATCAVMVTSRARLTGLEGVRWVDLDVFSPAESVRLLERVADDRVVTQVADAARIARLCGGLPLAVRIAGARLAARPAWRLAHMATMLDDEHRRLDRLAAGDLAVRASLALSYQGLDEGPRRLFRLLGLFDAPDFPAWLAAVVLDCPLAEACEHTEALVDAQLLTLTPPDRTGQHRYRFHDLVRLFAHERACVEESEEQRRRTICRGLGGWLALAEGMSARVPGPCYAPIHSPAPRPMLGWATEYLCQLDPRDWFDTERAALRSGVRQACRHGLDDVAFDLAGCLEKYFDLCGMYADWAAMNTEALAVCRSKGNRLGEAVMRRGLLDVTTWIADGRGEDAMARLRVEGLRLLELFTELGHEPGACDAAVMCAWALAAEGAYGEALAMVGRALELAERSGHLGGDVRARLALALAYYEQAQFATAVDQASVALDKARVLGNARMEATALQFLGIAYRELCQFDTSERMLEQSVEICRRYRDHYTEALSVIALARLYVICGDPRMRGAAATSLALSREYNMSHHVAESLGILGDIELVDGCHRRAAGYLEESVAIWRARGWHSFQAAALVSLGRAQSQTDPRAARESFTEAHALFIRLGKTTQAADAGRLAQRVWCRAADPMPAGSPGDAELVADVEAGAVYASYQVRGGAEWPDSGTLTVR